mgnify:CR=1 FL=1
MALGQRLEIRQGQSLVMTPQLQQAIKLLQLSNIELAEYCEAELEKNPLLERDESQPRDDERESVEKQSASERADESLAREDFSKVADLDPSAQDNMYDDDPSQRLAAAGGQPLTDWTTVRSAGRFDGEDDGLESTLAGGGTLKDHLDAQLAIAALLPPMVEKKHGAIVVIGSRAAVQPATSKNAAAYAAWWAPVLARSWRMSSMLPLGSTTTCRPAVLITQALLAARTCPASAHVGSPHGTERTSSGESPTAAGSITAST